MTDEVLREATILSAMPPYNISSPAKMKNGIARNENTFIPHIIRWKMTVNGRPS